MHPIPLVDGAFFIDNSSMERQTTCPRSAQYYICQKREAAEDRAALLFGKGVHSVLETRYHNIHLPVNEVRPLLHSKVSEVFQTYHPEPDEYRNYDCMLRVADGYLDRYPFEEFRVHHIEKDGVRTPAIEIPFAVPIGELDVKGELLVREVDGTVHVKYIDKLPIVWTGRIDLIYESQGRLYLMDHKTTSMMGAQYFKEFELSHQVYGYVYSASKLLGRQIFGFCVNAIAVRRPTKTGKGIEFERFIVPLDQALVDEWLDDTLHIVSDFVEMARRGYFPKHTKWCVGKYGVCSYAPVCGIAPNQREMMLMSGMYKNVTWSPLT